MAYVTPFLLYVCIFVLICFFLNYYLNNLVRKHLFLFNRLSLTIIDELLFKRPTLLLFPFYKRLTNQIFVP